MTTTGVGSGTWYFEYHVVYQSATTSVGVNLQVDHTGTVTRVRTQRHGLTGLATAADGIADNVVQALTGGVVQGWAVRTDNGALGPSTGVDTVNVDQYEILRGMIVTSATGSLELEHASETATSTQVMAETWLKLMKLN